MTHKDFYHRTHSHPQLLSRTPIPYRDFYGAVAPRERNQLTSLHIGEGPSQDPHVGAPTVTCAAGPTRPRGDVADQGPEPVHIDHFANHTGPFLTGVGIGASSGSLIAWPRCVRAAPRASCPAAGRTDRAPETSAPRLRGPGATRNARPAGGTRAGRCRGDEVVAPAEAASARRSVPTPGSTTARCTVSWGSDATRATRCTAPGTSPNGAPGGRCPRAPHRARATTARPSPPLRSRRRPRNR